jgi:signal transduction histidine kinase
VTAVLADLRSRLLLAAGLATLLAGGIGLFLAGGIARPLAALTLAADRLRAGDFDHPIGVEGRDELAQLAGSFASMRERMKNVEAMRTRFVSDVSHELRTPLTAIKGITETLQEGAIEDRQARGRFLDTIEAETDRLIRLVNDLLMLSRADSQRHQLRQQQVDLKAVMNSTYQLFSTQLQEKGIEWFKMVPPGDLTVHADPDRLAQLLSNLLDNACAHTPAQGEIWITAGQIHAQGGSMQPGRDRRRAFPTPADLPAPGAPLEDGAWLLLTIRDTGAGISATDLPHVFERFYRADKSRARGYGGSGLGLPIAKSLVEAHGGHIWLESPAKSQPRSAFPGTRAYVALPLSP